MWVKNVCLPEELVSALAEKRLVIFAGAGVSKNAPSNYPDFRQLASQVARQAGGIANSSSGWEFLCRFAIQ